jgi:hypothetical protein
MSTRAFIKFVSGKDSITLYNHSDGYPSGVLSDLDLFFKWDGLNSRGLSYTIANYVTYQKLRFVTQYEKEDIKKQLSNPDHNGYLHLGFGIQSDLTEKELLDSWGEWYYVVDFDKFRISVYQISTKKLTPNGSSKILVEKTDKPFESHKYLGLEHNKTLVKEVEAY